MTYKQLTQLCAEWQQRLRLQDWTVSIEFAREEAVQGDGRTKFNKNLKTARILICTPETHYFGPTEEVYDAEQIIVHELLHLHFIYLNNLEEKGISYNLFEQAIDLTAWALVRAKRGA